MRSRPCRPRRSTRSPASHRQSHHRAGAFIGGMDCVGLAGLRHQRDRNAAPHGSGADLCPPLRAAAIIARSTAVVMKPNGGKMLALIQPTLPAPWLETHPLPTSADQMGSSERATSPSAAEAGQSAKRHRPIGKRGPDSRTKPIGAAAHPPGTYYLIGKIAISITI